MAVSAKVVTAALTAGANGSTTDFASGFSGAPDCAIVIGSYANTTNNPQPNYSISVGFYDGTTQGCVTGFSADNQAAALTSRNQRTDSIAWFCDGGSANFCRYTASWSTNDLRLTMADDNTGTSRYATAILLKGVKSKKVGTVVLNGTTAVDVTAPGFKPTLLFLTTAALGNGDNGSGSTNDLGFSFGVAHCSSGGTISQQCVHLASDDAATTQIVNSGIEDAKAVRQYRTDGGNTDWSATVSDFDANGFSITASTAGIVSVVHYLAIELNNPDDAYADVVDSNATLTSVITGTPVVAGFVGTTHTTTNSTTADPDSAISLCVTDGTTSASHISADEDNLSAASNANTEYTTNAFEIRFDDLTADAVASASFSAGGLTLTYSDSPAATRKILVWAIGPDSTAVNVNLTGVAGTGAVGSLSKSASKALTGVAATADIGSLAPTTSYTVALSGLAATSSVGVFAPRATVALSGLEASGAVGSLSPAVGATVPLVGLAASASVGSLTPTATVALTGLAATGAVGSLTATSGVTVGMTGIAGTGAVGSLSLEIDVGLTGVAATAAVGTLVPTQTGGTVTVSLTGLEATAAIGSFDILGQVLPTGGGAGWPVIEERDTRPRHKSTFELTREILNEVDEEMREAVAGEPLEDVLKQPLDVAGIAGRMTRRPARIESAGDDEDDDLLLLSH